MTKFGSATSLWLASLALMPAMPADASPSRPWMVPPSAQESTTPSNVACTFGSADLDFDVQVACARSFLKNGGVDDKERASSFLSAQLTNGAPVADPAGVRLDLARFADATGDKAAALALVAENVADEEQETPNSAELMGQLLASERPDTAAKECGAARGSPRELVACARGIASVRSDAPGLSHLAVFAASQSATIGDTERSLLSSSVTGFNGILKSPCEASEDALSGFGAAAVLSRLSREGTSQADRLCLERLAAKSCIRELSQGRRRCSDEDAPTTYVIDAGRDTPDALTWKIEGTSASASRVKLKVELALARVGLRDVDEDFPSRWEARFGSVAPMQGTDVQWGLLFASASSVALVSAGAGAFVWAIDADARVQARKTFGASDRDFVVCWGWTVVLGGATVSAAGLGVGAWSAWTFAHQRPAE